VGNDVSLEGGGGAMEAAVNVSKSIRSSAVPGAPVVALTRTGAFRLMAGFGVQLLQRGTHPHQLVTNHGRQYIAGFGAQKANYGRNLME
jgi:hypothetical protein